MKENNWSIEDEGLPPDNDPMWSALASEAVKDNRTVDRPEDPCIQQESERHELVSDAAMEKLKTAINDFVKREYDIEPTEEFFDNPAYIGIAETSVEGRDDIVIDMAVNLDKLTLDQYINGEKMDSWYYADIHSLISKINHISFDELVSLGPNAA